VAHWIRTPDELASFARELPGVSALALDSESDSLYHHFEKVCLIQLATDRGEIRLLDTLSVRDLGPLAPVLADPGVVKVLHGADYDVTTLKRDFGLRIESLFDTMIAARMLGRSEVGLQAVARDELGVAISKASQRDDWSRRPLTPAQEAYAEDDVRHLVALYRLLSDKLRAAGRLEWVLEESAAVAALEPARRQPDAEAYLRIKGARRLDPRGRAVLRELAAWRESRAEATDVPAFRILGNEALLGLATRRPRTTGELARLRLLPPRVRPHAAVLVAAIARGMALPADQVPRLPPPPPKPVVSEAVRRRAVALKAWRVEEARRLGVDVSVVLPQRLLDRVADAAPGSLDELARIEGLRRWRVAALGASLIAALDAAKTLS
jgi:ribonuclease D